MKKRNIHFFVFYLFFSDLTFCFFCFHVCFCLVPEPLWGVDVHPLCLAKWYPILWKLTQYVPLKMSACFTKNGITCFAIFNSFILFVPIRIKLNYRNWEFSRPDEEAVFYIKGRSEDPWFRFTDSQAIGERRLLDAEACILPQPVPSSASSNRALSRCAFKHLWPT